MLIIHSADGCVGSAVSLDYFPLVGSALSLNDFPLPTIELPFLGRSSRSLATITTKLSEVLK